MKKAILPAMISALLATSAHAANVYDVDGTSADVYGRMQFDISNDGSATDGAGSARMGFKGKSAINQDMNAIAKGEWQMAAENSAADDKQLNARHLYLGFETAEMGTLIFGQTDTAFYQAVAATDMYNTYGYGAFAHVEDGRQEGQVIYSGEFAGVSVDASYQFKDESFANPAQDNIKNNGDETTTLDNAYALTLGYSIADVTIHAGYQVEKFASLKDKENYALSAAYTLDDLYLAAVFAGSDQENVAAYQGYDLFASYAIDATSVYGGYTFQANTDTNKDTVNEITLGTQYAFNDNMKAWVEYKADMKNGTDDAWTVAVQYNF
ncbi:MAG: porin [Psychromonas sp.]|nr:porin [Psychromonas sp.]